MKKLLFFAFIFMVCFSVLSYAAKEETIAKAEIIKGKVTYAVKKDKKEKAVKINQKFQSGVYIKTGKQSAITLKFKNGSLVELKENSRILLNRELMNKTSVSLLQGNGAFKIQKLLKGKEEFNVFTPTAVAGVRGTDFELGVAPDGSAAVNVSDGKVAVNNDSQTVSLSKNESTVSSLGDEKLTRDQGAKNLEEVSKAKSEEMNKDPLAKLNAISQKFDTTLGDQQGLVNTLSDTKNTNAASGVNRGLFNQAKSEGLFAVAGAIKAQNSQDRMVNNIYKKINSLYERLNRLNRIMDEKFGKLDKIYQKKEEDLLKMMEQKEKLMNEKYKNFDRSEEDDTGSGANRP